jgi:hypothetical protein
MLLALLLLLKEYQSISVDDAISERISTPTETIAAVPLVLFGSGIRAASAVAHLNV